MKPDNEKFLKFSVLTFAIASLAFFLYLVFCKAYHPEMTVFDSRALGYGLLLHIPAWTFALLFAGLILKKPFPRKMTFILEIILFISLAAPFAMAEIRKYFDHIEFGFYLTTYLLCVALLLKLRQRFID